MGILDNIDDSLRSGNEYVDIIEYGQYLNYLFGKINVKDYNKAVKLLVEKSANWLQPFNDYKEYIEGNITKYMSNEYFTFNNSIPPILAYTPATGRHPALLDIFDIYKDKPNYHLTFHTGGEIYEYMNHMMDVYPNTIIYKINDTNKFNILIKQITKIQTWYW